MRKLGYAALGILWAGSVIGGFVLGGYYYARSDYSDMIKKLSEKPKFVYVSRPLTPSDLQNLVDSTESENNGRKLKDRLNFKLLTAGYNKTNALARGIVIGDDGYAYLIDFDIHGKSGSVEEIAIPENYRLE